ncbi:MAG: GAF domain-containing protein [Euryarchaeota archaeon]|nr:GAF domain-containing protein [Euryarchaeota archaeon]
MKGGSRKGTSAGDRAVGESSGAVLEALRQGEHLCSIFKDAEQQFSVVVPFIAEGLRRGEKCIYVLDTSTREEVLEAFRRRGVDLEEYVESGQLEFLNAGEVYLRGGRFDPGEVISLLGGVEERVLKEGYSGIRGTGEMSWVLSLGGEMDRLVEYEAELNRFLEGRRILALCQYREDLFPAEVLLNVIHTHPRVLIYGTLCENRFYVPPEEFLARSRGEPVRRIYRQVRDELLQAAERERERLRAEEELRERAKKLELLSDMVVDIGQELEYDRILWKAAEKAAELVEAETVAVPVVDREASRITYPAAYGLHADKLVGRSKPLRRRSICGWVIRNRKPFFSEDISRDPRETEEVKRQFNLRSVIAAPMLYKGEVFGSITALNKRGGGSFTRNDLQLLCIFAGSVAVSLNNARLLGEVRDYAERLKRSNQLKELFIDIMQHDLLTPLSVIRGVSDLLLTEDPDNEDLQIIRKSADRVIGMIENAAKLSRLESGEKLEMRPMDLGEVVRTAVEDSRRLFESAGMVVENRVSGPLPVRADPIIVDVFLNLLSNAAKYAREGGRVVIEAMDGEGRCTVMVRDFGPGIPDEDKGAIFTRFSRREKGGIKGTGLGLAIAKRIVELHGGRIWVEDNTPRGAVFCVQLPRLEDEE